MRTSNAFLALVLTGVLTGTLSGVIGGPSAPGPAVAAEKKTASSSELLEKGLQFYRSGDYAAAVPILELAAKDNAFMAQYALAQIYADNAGTMTDHAKSYMLFQAIADEYSDVDPDDQRRAPFVARALTALAGYLRVGLPSIGVEPDPDRAADYLHHAALFFGNEDAQFELVKLKLQGDGLPADIASAKHWLSVLTQRGHAGAQAFLADLYWRGKIMNKDPVRALALISVAVENAPMRERIWIEDVYQNVFCGAGEGVRTQATGIVAEWRTRYGRQPESNSSRGLAPIDVHPVRTCQNGERVAPLQAAAGTRVAPPAIEPPKATGTIPTPLPIPLSVQPGQPSGDGIREVGVTTAGGPSALGAGPSLGFAPPTTAR